jgi:ribonuclease VapC
MVIDTSALVAILQDEPERRAFNEAIEAAPSCRISAATLVEASIVFEARHGADGVRELDLFVAAAAIHIVPVEARRAAVEADDLTLAGSPGRGSARRGDTAGSGVTR